MNVRRFRVVVVVWAALHVWLATLPYTAYDKPGGYHEAMEYSGRGALLAPTETVSNAFLAAVIGAALGLLLLQNWGRVLLLATVFVTVLLAPLSGLTISGPFDGTLALLVTLLSAALVAIAYWSPVARAFNPEQELDEEVEGDELVLVFESSSLSESVMVHSLLRDAQIDYTADRSEKGVRFLVNSADAVVAKDVLELAAEPN